MERTRILPPEERVTLAELSKDQLDPGTVAYVHGPDQLVLALSGTHDALKGLICDGAFDIFDDRQCKVISLN